MTKEDVRTLKVGDLVTWKDPDTCEETIEVVTENGCEKERIHVQLRTIAVLYDPNNGANIGDEGWIHQYNCVCMEKLA